MKCAIFTFLLGAALVLANPLSPSPEHHTEDDRIIHTFFNTPVPPYMKARDVPAVPDHETKEDAVDALKTKTKTKVKTKTKTKTKTKKPKTTVTVTTTEDGSTPTFSVTLPTERPTEVPTGVPGDGDDDDDEED